MAIETRVAQKEKLYALLRVKKGYQDAGLEVLAVLEEAIEYAKAPMEAEDISHIEKQVFSK
jgi:DNA helicase HerA-like ATPase